MTLPLVKSAIASALHLLALGMGLGAAFARGRGRALRGPVDTAALQRALIRWRVARGKGRALPADWPEAARRIARLSFIEVGGIVCIVFIAALMARGVGQF